MPAMPADTIQAKILCYVEAVLTNNLPNVFLSDSTMHGDIYWILHEILHPEDLILDG